MKRRLTGLALAVVMVAVMLAPASAAAAGSGITVKLPGFKVTLNGVTVDNAYLEYPLLVYSGITYFPMTYNFARFLGLETDWRGSAEGLYVDKTGVTAAYNPTTRAAANASSYTATIPAFPVVVNGREVDNSNATWPFFVFRGVTYFPLTWENCVENFGWGASHGEWAGQLSMTSTNPFVTQYKLPSDIAAADSGYFAVTATDKYFYYCDGKGNIRQTPLDGGASKVVYELPINSYFSPENYALPTLYTEGGEAYLNYYTGGASMGSDLVFQLHDDGTVSESQDVKDWYAYKSGDMTARMYSSLFGSTLTISRGESAIFSDYTYRWGAHSNGETIGGGGDAACGHFAGGKFYALAIPPEGGLSAVYSVDLATGDVEKAFDKNISGFKGDGDYLYYYDGAFYSYNLTTGTETLIRDTAPVGEYEVLGGVLYWTGSTGMLYSSDRGVSEWFDASNCHVASAMELKDGYMLFTFGGIPPEEGLVKYRVAAIDAEKNVVFKTSDTALNGVSLDGGRLSYVNADTMTWCVVELG